MRTRLAAVAAGAVALTAAAPAGALPVKKKRLHVRVGHTVVVVGDGAPSGVARLQVRRRGALADDRPRPHDDDRPLRPARPRAAAR